MLKVGIISPVVIETVAMKEIANKNVPSIKVVKPVEDMLAALNAGEDIQNESQEYVPAWPVESTKRDGSVKNTADMIKEISEMKGRYEEILRGYFPKNEAAISMVEGTGIKTNADLEKLPTDAALLAKLNASIFNQFITKMAKANLSKKFQFKTTRKSSVSHTSTVPRFGRFWAAIEEVNVLAYTTKEVEGGWNNPNPVAADTNDTNSATEERPF
jgi:hypothetical protein